MLFWRSDPSGSLPHPLLAVPSTHIWVGRKNTESKSFLRANAIERDTGWQRVCVVRYAHACTLPPSVHLGPAQIRIAVWVQKLLLCKLEEAASGLQRPAIRQEHQKFKLSQRMCTWFNYYSTRAQYQGITSLISTQVSQNTRRTLSEPMLEHRRIESTPERIPLLE